MKSGIVARARRAGKTARHRTNGKHRLQRRTRINGVARISVNGSAAGFSVQPDEETSGRAVSSPPQVVSTHVPRLLPAKAGDHAAVHRLLLSLFHGPSSIEFQAQIDEPLYEPTDRLLVKHHEEVVAHLRLTKRLLHFGPLQIASAGFMDLATAPPYQRRGFASALLRAGEQQATGDGAALGLTRTTAPELFARHGWSVCGGQMYSTCGARQILAHLRAIAPADFITWEGDEDGPISPLAAHAPRMPLLVRPLRRLELPAIMNLYEQSTDQSYGATVRSEVYWDWLMARRAFDRAYVAILGDDRLDLPQLLAAVAGCAFVRDNRLVELVTRPGASEAIGQRLLARVCYDAIEKNRHDVRLDAPPQHPLHQLVRAAGGTWHAHEQSGEVPMARLFDPLRTIGGMLELLQQRAVSADLARPLALGLEIYNFDADLRRATPDDAASYQLCFTGRSMKLLPGKLGRNYLSLRRRDLTPLLLGHWKLADALAAGRARASTRLAQQTAAVLFPPLPWHRSPLDELLA